MGTGICYHLTAALNQMGNSHSSSALSHIPTPASRQTPRLASQLQGRRASGQRSQIFPPLTANAIPSGTDWGISGVGRSREQRTFRCCTRKLWLHSFCTQGMSGSSVDNLAAIESCWVSSDVINRRKKSNKSSPKAVVPNHESSLLSEAWQH